MPSCHPRDRGQDCARRRRLRAGLRRFALVSSLVLLALLFAPPAEADEPATPTLAGLLAESDPLASCADPDLNTLSAVECVDLEVVESLDPAYTSSGVSAAHSHTGEDGLPAFCRLAAEAVFFAATDWNRLAGKLAQDPSPCAHYWISIPPLVRDKTLPRPDQAHRIRALGPRFHAMAEIHLASWARWVRDNGKTWFEAGVEARRRMAAAGYDVSQGDTWAINELPSSVRRNEGTVRQDVRDFVLGLFLGDGSEPTSKGLVFVIGLSQRLADTSVYKMTMKGWLEDSEFWADMERYVRFWAQEVYADARAWGVARAPRATRADFLSDFLQHPIVLAEVAPESVEAARAFFRRAYTPLANAAWPWDFGFGWTVISAEQMQQFISSQMYATRHFAGSHPQGAPEGRLGYAWAPNRPDDVPPADFARESGEILERLASSIHHSYEQGGSSPAGACGPPGDHVWCDGDVEGASFNDAWEALASWE